MRMYECPTRKARGTKATMWLLVMSDQRKEKALTSISICSRTHLGIYFAAGLRGPAGGSKHGYAAHAGFNAGASARHARVGEAATMQRTWSRKHNPGIARDIARQRNWPADQRPERFDPFAGSELQNLPFQRQMRNCAAAIGHQAALRAVQNEGGIPYARSNSTAFKSDGVRFPFASSLA